MQKRVLELLITILLVIVSIQFISSSASCDIVNRDACGGGSYIVMGVSDLTNAHGEFPDAGTYGSVLCCDFQKVRGATCVGTNKIIGLSSSTNAHAEEPYPVGGATYTTPVCYDDLECVRTSSSCPKDYPLSVLSLSSFTNAHIGASGDYPDYPNYQICCMTSALQHEICQLTNAYWEYEEVYEGTNVGLIVKGTDCDGVRIKFEIYKKVVLVWIKIGESPGDTSFDGNTATGYWIAEEPGEFYFKATLIEDNSKYKDSGELEVNEREVGYCNEIFLCNDYTLKSECDIDDCDVAEDSAPRIVDCDNPLINCSCFWDTETEECDFAASSGGNGGGFEAGTCEYKQETTDDCADGYLTYNYTAIWTGLPEDKPSWCENDTETIECPLRAQFPFFNTYSILIAIALIVLIYIILIRKKSSRKKRK